MLGTDTDNKQVISYNPRYKSLFVYDPEASDRRDQYYFYDESLNPTLANRNEGIWLKDRLVHFLERVENPIWIVNGHTEIFNEIDWPTDRLERFRKKGIDVFFYDVLVMEKTGTNSKGRETYRSFELENLQKFIEANQIEGPVNVFLCEKYIEEDQFDNHQNFSFKIHSLDIFIEEQIRQIHAFTGNSNNITFGVGFEKPKYKAVCLNFRYEPVRELVMGFIRSKDYSKMVRKSFYHKHNFNYLKDKLGFSPDQLKHWNDIKKGIDLLQDEIPYGVNAKNLRPADPIDQHIPDMNAGYSVLENDEGINSIDRIRPEQPYQHVLLSIVTESKINVDYCCISEKTLFPMLYHTPFLLLSGRHSLKYLQEMGFKTYGEVIDESYDNIADHGQRIDAAMDSIDKLLTLPKSELKEIMMSQIKIIKSNRLHILRGMNDWFFKAYSEMKAK